MSLFRKSLILIGLVVGAFVIGQLILMGLLIIGGANMSEGTNKIELIRSLDNIIPFKLGIGINTILMFAVSAILFHSIVIKEKRMKYFAVGQGIQSLRLGLSTLLLISVYPLLSYLSRLIQNIELPNWAQSMDQDSMDIIAIILEMNGPWDLLLNLLIVALLPAICEELLFRGVIQKELNKHLRNPHIGILITSVIFSAVHFSVEGFPSRVILGMVLGYVYYFTKNLWYPILLHLFNNGVLLLGLYFSDLDVKDLDPLEASEVHWSAAIVSIAVAIVIFMALKTKSEKDGISA